MEQRTEGMKRQAQELIEQAYQRGYNTGYSKAENDYYAKTEDDRKASYELGLNMAWEAARKIMNMPEDGGLSDITLIDLFKGCSYVDIVNNYSASEAIEKLRAYEEQKKQEDDSEIKVGDEVIYNCGNDKDKAVVIDIDVDELHLLTKNGCYISEKFKDVKKTNRNFSEIAEVLKKMQGQGSS